MIGNGSSGIQIVPAILPDVSHIDHYIRGRTWLSPTFAREKIDERGGAGLDNSKLRGLSTSSAEHADISVVSFTAEEIEKFKTDHQAYQKFRKGRSIHMLHLYTMGKSYPDDF